MSGEVIALSMEEVDAMNVRSRRIDLLGRLIADAVTERPLHVPPDPIIRPWVEEFRNLRQAEQAVLDHLLVQAEGSPPPGSSK